MMVFFFSLEHMDSIVLAWVDQEHSCGLKNRTRTPFDSVVSRNWAKFHFLLLGEELFIGAFTPLREWIGWLGQR